MFHLPFRIGATSYAIPADLTANAEFLRRQVHDMQLVLFEVEHGPSNLPSADQIAQLQKISAESGLTYSVHLLYDIPPLNDPAHLALRKARQVIDLTAPLSPSAYVLHLDGRALQAAQQWQGAAMRQWQTRCAQNLRQIVDWVGDGRQVAVENLEGYPPDWVTPVAERAGVSRCVDIGHLWRDGHDPLPWLARSLPATRIIHLHGVQAGQDHRSLAHMAPAALDPLIRFLLQHNYPGIVTLEVFEEADFTSSLRALHESVQRCLLESL